MVQRLRAVSAFKRTWILNQVPRPHTGWLATAFSGLFLLWGYLHTHMNLLKSVLKKKERIAWQVKTLSIKTDSPSFIPKTSMEEKIDSRILVTDIHTINGESLNKEWKKRKKEQTRLKCVRHGCTPIIPALSRQSQENQQKFKDCLFSIVSSRPQIALCFRGEKNPKNLECLPIIPTLRKWRQGDNLLTCSRPAWDSWDPVSKINYLIVEK